MNVAEAGAEAAARGKSRMESDETRVSVLYPRHRVMHPRRYAQ